MVLFLVSSFGALLLSLAAGDPMPCSEVQVARQALFALLRTLADCYGLPRAKLDCDASEPELVREFRRVLRHAHLDKGGSEADTDLAVPPGQGELECLRV